MSSYEIIYCSISVFFSTLSQVLFKMIVISDAIKSKLIFFLTGCCCVVMSVFFVVIALKTMELKNLVLFASLAYVIVPIYCRFLFNEKLNYSFWLGTFFIIVGISII